MTFIPQRIQAIVEEVAAEYRITTSDLYGRSQEWRVARPRFDAWARIRALERRDGSPVFSTPQIGAAFNRHHTTIMNGLQRAAELFPQHAPKVPARYEYEETRI